MKAFWNRVLAALYFYICFAPVPMLLGSWLVGSFLPALIAAACMLPLSLVIVLLPDKVGGRKKKNVVQQARGSGDPDPDRNLRSDALPVKTRSFSFPLRVFVLITCALAILFVVMFMPVMGLDGVFVFYRFLLGVSLSVMMMMAEYCIATGEACNRTAILTGIVVYLAAGFLATYGMEDILLRNTMYYMGAGFLLITGFLLNERALTAGAIASQAYKPPRTIVIRNRIILGVFAVVVGIISQFDNLRRVTSNAFRGVLRAIVKVIAWLNSFIDPETTYVMSEREQEVMEAGESVSTAAEWSAAEIAGIAFALILGAALVVLIMVKLLKWTKKFREKLKEWLKGFASGVGEEYEDVRESLMDFKEARENLGETLKQRLAKLVKRDPKWADLNAKERVRFLMTLIYRKNAEAVPEYGQLTAHEALSVMKSGFKQPDSFADLYDRARYSQHDVSLDEADAAKREAKL